MWQGILGHDSNVEKFHRAARRGRLFGSFLFIGPPGVGKKMFAFALAKTLFCRDRSPDVFEPCGNCPSCLAFPGHPDLFVVSKPDDKTEIPLELLIGSKENRGREGLCYEISRTPFMGNRKIAIIDDADYFNEAGANSLLKTLEEPPSNSLLILLGTSATKQLPTIRSRCQMIRFAPLSKQNLEMILRNTDADESLETFRKNFEQTLSAPQTDPVQLAISLNEFIDSAGKESQVKRERLRSVFAMVLDHDRALVENTGQDDPVKRTRFVRRIERTLDALEQIGRNVNLPLIVEHWVND
ncbi:MAG: AAA family ATPase [Planctomycetaceae bacterium]|nr:AAA family ATPase [Planctomycetaceae bacterium]